MDNLKCSKCREYLSVPIFICIKTKASTTPHVQCGKCCLSPNQIALIQECYICQAKLERNHLMEKVILQAKHPCIYEKEGCTFNLHIDQKSNHENHECFYRPIECSAIKKFSEQWNCDWSDKLENFYDHFRGKHANNVYKYTSDKNEQKIKINFNKKSVSFYLFSAHFRLFWLIHELNPEVQKAYWTIQFIGPKNKSSCFYYEFEFFEINEPIRKYKITEYCESHLTSHKSIFTSGKCVAISWNTLTSFMINGEISFRFRVCKNNKSIEHSKSVDNNNIHKSKIEKSTLNLQSISYKNNSGAIIGSSPIATNSPPLNLPTVSRAPRSKSVHSRRRH